MRFKNRDADIYVPDGLGSGPAIERTTHMAISAHQDDIEIMAYDGIVQCYEKADRWFFGVVATDGTGSVRTGEYSNHNDYEYKMVRCNEQKKAADIGKYGAVALLDYTSAYVKAAPAQDLVNELAELLAMASPGTVYTHNPTDKHQTHVAVAIRTIAAIRSLPKRSRPEKLYGCEVWRSLDWMPDEDKTVFDVDMRTDLALRLLEVFRSQISGAKKYDKAAMARRLANSTFYDSYATDSSNSLIFAMDLTPLITDDSIDIAAYVDCFISKFRTEVTENIYKAMKVKQL